MIESGGDLKRSLMIRYFNLLLSRVYEAKSIAVWDM